MKLAEILSEARDIEVDSKEPANRPSYNRNKPKRGRMLAKLLRSRSKRYNPTPSKTPDHGTWDPFGGMTGFPSWKTWSVDQSNWRTGG